MTNHDNEEDKKEIVVKPNYFKFNLMVLLIFGIDIIKIENKLLRYIFYAYAIVSICIVVYLFMVVEAIETLTQTTDFYSMSFGLSYFITHVLGATKVTILVLKRGNIRTLLDKIETGIFRPNLERGGRKEFDLINAAIKNCNNQGKFFYTLVFIIIGLRCTYAAKSSGTDIHLMDEITNSTVVKHITTMPYLTWFPFDKNKHPYYEIGFIYQTYCTVVYGMYIGSADAIICGFMMHIKAQFLILKLSLYSLIDRASKKVSQDLDPNIIYDTTYDKVIIPKNITQEKKFSQGVLKQVEKLVMQSVYHHQELIKFCEEIEDGFTYLMLLQFLSSVLILCLQLFQLSLTDIASPEFASMTFYLCLMMFQILCYCWHGNEVILVSSDVPKFVFHIDWIMLNESAKKGLLMMMMRAQRPIRFTTGKFAFLSLETYMTIVRGAGSYFMVLRQMNS